MASIQKRVSDRTGQTTWRVDYRDAQGIRRAKTFKTKKEANDWKSRTEYEIRQGVHTPERLSVTVAEAGELWIEAANKRGLERSTVNEYRNHLKNHINPVIGHTKLARLTAPSVEAFVDQLQEQRSPAMISKALASLRALIGDAQRRGLVAQNVALPVRRRISSRHKKEIIIPSKDEIRALIAGAEGRWKPHFITAILTGMRASELRGLTWEHVDFDGLIIQVRQRVDQWNQFGSPKSKAGIRDIPLGPTVVETLRSWRRHCPVGPHGLVFPNGRGNVESQANIYSRGFAPLMRKCGFVKEKNSLSFNFHALRHAAASLMIEQGLTPKRIQTIMGHSSITMTFDTYGHLWNDPEGDKQAMAEIEKRLFST